MCIKYKLNLDSMTVPKKEQEDAKEEERKRKGGGGVEKTLIRVYETILRKINKLLCYICEAN